MKVSTCCLTFGRTAQLQEALESWLRQDYSGHELVIFNSLPSQKIEFKHPNVRIINAHIRPNSLGDTRNQAIRACRGEYILNLDDDDIILPWYLSWLMARVGDNEWVRQALRLNLHGNTIQSITEQATNQLLFKKSLWEKVGGYPAKNSGEDAGFRKLIQQHRGTELACEPREIGFIYGWGRGPYNVSALGEDVAGRPSAMQETQRLLRKRAPKGGRVVLRPIWRTDYCQLTRRWLVNNGHKA